MDMRTALLDSAELACRRRGYDGFSYADLSADVGIRKASIHHHFPTKADLALALINRYTDGVRGRLDRVAAKDAAAGEQLRAYAKIYRSALSRGEMLCLCVALSAGRDSVSGPVLDRLEAFRRDSIAWLAALFEKGRRDGSIKNVGAPLDEAAACLAVMEGAQLAARAARNVALFDDATRLLLARAAE